jgi:integrase
VLRAIQTQARKLGLEGVGAHSLRHSAAGLLRSAGLGDETIAATLRHSSTRVTQVVYGSMSPDDLTAVRMAAADALS